MLQAVTLGRLEAYQQLIHKMAVRYPGNWDTIYQADVRCRSILMSRIKRELEEQKALAVAN
eukprot:6455124-Amphidinium_carterae.1